MADNLYQEYGGAPAVAAIVQDFYDRLNADNNLAGYFKNIDLAALIAHQTNFIGKALGGPEVYDGRDLANAHAGLDIDDNAFAGVAGHLAAALATAGVESADVDGIIELVGSLKDQIVAA